MCLFIASQKFIARFTGIQCLKKCGRNIKPNDSTIESEVAVVVPCCGSGADIKIELKTPMLDKKLP